MKNNEIIELLYRLPPEEHGDYFYDTVDNLLKNHGDTSLLTDRRLKSLSNLYKKKYNRDISAGLVPLFEIVDEQSGAISWCYNLSKYHPYQRLGLKNRYRIYRFIDSLDDRKFEALACVICDMLGAKKTILTIPGNEGGVDFISSITFTKKAHYLFGIKGPLRIIGQCKKHSSKAKVSHIKEFITTMDQVYNWSYRMGNILPLWFKECGGYIIPWYISHMGYQSGALDLAKNYGIITSDVNEIVEILVKSKTLHHEPNIEHTLNALLENYLKYSVDTT